MSGFLSFSIHVLFWLLDWTGKLCLGVVSFVFHISLTSETMPALLATNTELQASVCSGISTEPKTVLFKLLLTFLFSRHLLVRIFYRNLSKFFLLSYSVDFIYWSYLPQALLPHSSAFSTIGSREFLQLWFRYSDQSTLIACHST